MDISIKNACENHIDGIYSLLNQLVEFQKMSVEFKIDKNKLFELIFVEKSINALIAQIDSKIVGIALYHTNSVSVFSGKKILNLEAIYIVDDFRKMNIGREFFTKLRSIAKDEKCCKIEWKCNSWNVSAGNFFKVVGSKQDEGFTSFSINHI